MESPFPASCVLPWLILFCINTLVSQSTQNLCKPRNNLFNHTLLSDALQSAKGLLFHFLNNPSLSLSSLSMYLILSDHKTRNSQRRKSSEKPWEKSTIRNSKNSNLILIFLPPVWKDNTFLLFVPRMGTDKIIIWKFH